MPRKKSESLEAGRAAIKREYKRGTKREKRIESTDKLTEVEVATKKEAACFLKAANYSYTYIGEALNVTKSIVKHWFEDPAMRTRVDEIQTDFLNGAVKLLRTYAIELIEMLVEIARTTDDDKIAIQAITEALDRMGLAKVNKSESVSAVTERREVDIVDKGGFLDALKGAPPEVQARAAEHMEEMMALAAEHTELDVTHA